MSISLHRTLLALACAVFAAGCATSCAEPAVSFDDVAQKARELAAAPYQEPPPVPKAIADIGYDQWRDIRFDPERALWKEEGLPFRIQFFHAGYLYRHAVRIHEVHDAGAREIRFSKDFFSYGSNVFGDLPPDLGFAGFRVHTQLNREGVFDEVIVFLGASYFRAVAEGQHYGLSARGLMVNAASAAGEEFPFFREFWIVRPEASDRRVTVLALLDGPSVAGAYRFVVTPGKETAVDVDARVWLRAPVEKLGIAPLTSMFYYGEHSSLEAQILDFRPEVHDSDGLFVALGNGDRVWRPLVNPHRLLINSFHAVDPQGFGLLQRDADFDHYQDLEARYDKRPSLWIEPVRAVDGDVWREGAVELIQIPTRNEYNDNIVASWAPAAMPEPGERLDFAYRMHWAGAVADRRLAAVEATRMTRSEDGHRRKYVIDFRGPSLEGISEDVPPEAEISLTGGQAHLARKQVMRNAPAEAWRLVFEIEDDRHALEQVLPTANVVEIRASLKSGGRTVTETWSYAVEF